jgi:hypothetical protein
MAKPSALCEFFSLCRLLIVMIVLLCTRPSVRTMEIISLALYLRLGVLIYFFLFQIYRMLTRN